MKEKTMKTLAQIVAGTALALGCSRPTGGRVENVALPESCAEVVNIERSALHTRGHYTYDVSCKDTDERYILYVCESDSRKYSCNPNVEFEPAERK